MAERAGAICFGSLAQRNPRSRETIQALAGATSAACIRIFDVNLRAPFFSGETIERSLELATVVKMNEDEAPRVLGLLGLAVSDEFAGVVAGRRAEEPRPPARLLRSAAERLLNEFPFLQMAAITRGCRGSLLVTRDEWHEHPGFPVKVADAIGAGDAFTAALAHYLLRGADLTTLNEAGNRWGGWVASQSGAMPTLPGAVHDAIAAAIEQAAE